MLDFCVFTDFENVGSVIELHQSLLAGRNTELQTQNFKRYHSISISTPFNHEHPVETVLPAGLHPAENSVLFRGGAAVAYHTPCLLTCLALLPESLQKNMK